MLEKYVSNDRFALFRARLEDAQSNIRIVASDPLALVGLVVLTVFAVLAVLAPVVAPYEPLEQHVVAGTEYEILRFGQPSWEHPLGTTAEGRDMLSIFIYGSRITLYIGFIAGILTGLIGFLIGLVSGYYGGYVDYLLMRLTDVVFGLPLLGMALVILALLGPSNETIILVLSLLLWRLPVRVIRSEVLSVKEREFVKSSRAAGAGNLHIMFRVIAPNVLPLTFLYMAYGVAWAITGEAGIAFLGFGDPETVSWGRALQLAFESGGIGSYWWIWVPPAVGISLTVTSVYFVLRGYEKVINPQLRDI